MKERPIIFKDEMARAILDGSKTQTRRIIKSNMFTGEGAHVNNCPFGNIGDRLWVRETHWPDIYGGNVIYRADGGEIGCHAWKPSIHMRREYSRVNLEITGVRVERLQDISEEDARDEGVKQFMRGCTRHESECRGLFRWLWEKINGAESWQDNPLVWVVEFERVE